MSQVFGLACRRITSSPTSTTPWHRPSRRPLWPSGGPARRSCASIGRIEVKFKPSRTSLPVWCPQNLIDTLGRQRLAANIDRIDPVVRDRISKAEELGATEYRRLSAAQNDLARRAAERMSELDAVVQPTSSITAVPVDQIDTVASAVDFNQRALGLTRLANAFSLCAVSIPMGRPGALPVGLDVASGAGTDHRLLALARSLENTLMSDLFL